MFLDAIADEKALWVLNLVLVVVQQLDDILEYFTHLSYMLVQCVADGVELSILLDCFLGEVALLKLLLDHHVGDVL